MKQIFLPKKLILILSIALLGFSCQKDQSNEGSESSEFLIYQSWLKNKGGAFKDGNMKMRLDNGKIINGKLNWNDSKKYSHDNTDYLSVPFKFSPESIINNEGDKSYRSWQLVFRGTNKGEIEAAIHSTTLGDIVEERSQTKIQGTIQNFTLLNGEQATLWVKMENSGKYALANQISNNESKSFSRTAMGCETFAVTTLVPYSYLGEGSGYEQEIVFGWYPVTNYITLCDDDAPIRKEKKKIWYIDGDNAGSMANDCSECDSQLSNLSEGVETSSETTEIRLITIDNHTKYKNPKWTCLRGLGWILSSKETGIIELVDPVANKWVWKSLTHNSIALTGTVIGGSVTPNSGTGTPSFVAGASNILYAGMSLDFDVTYSVICKGCGTPQISLNYVSSGGPWNAKPF